MHDCMTDDDAMSLMHASYCLTCAEIMSCRCQQACVARPLEWHCHQSVSLAKVRDSDSDEPCCSHDAEQSVLHHCRSHCVPQHRTTLNIRHLFGKVQLTLMKSLQRCKLTDFQEPLFLGCRTVMSLNPHLTVTQQGLTRQAGTSLRQRTLSK